MKKKSVSILVWLVSAVVALTVGILALSQDCVHTWSSWEITVAATCTKDGKQTRECLRCRETETRTIDATGHNFGGWKTTKNATCTQDGNQIHECRDCGATENQKIDKLGHNYQVVQEESVQATCQSVGVKVSKCSRCGNSKTEPLEMKEHSYSVEEPANPVATCMEAAHDGYYKCEYCGEPDPVDYAASIITPAHLSDDGWDVTVEPTCSTYGSMTQTCSVAGCPNEGQAQTKSIDPLPHTFVDVEELAATCMEAGYKAHSKCEYCGETVGYEVIQKLSHKFDDDGYCTLSYKDENGDSTTCGTFTYVFTINADGESYKLTGINKNSVSENRTVFNIPDDYNGLPVTEIDNNVFASFAYVREITLPQSVVSIGKSAFKNCVNLQKVTVRAGEGEATATLKVASVGAYAFEGCAKLNEFDFSSLTAIGENAFYGTAFEKIVLTDKVTSIGSSAFGATSKLKEIIVPYVGLTAGDGNVFGAIFGATNYDLPTSLQEVTVLSATNVTALVQGAFESAQYLTKITLPKNLVTFGESAFEDCTALSEIYVGEKSNDFSNATEVGAKMLKGTKLKSLVLPYLGNGKDVTNLGYLYGGQNTSVSKTLISVTLPTVERIAANAFAGCSFIVTMKAEKLKEIGEEAFNNCSSLKNLITDANLNGVVLDAEVTSIGFGAFVGCTAIETMFVPFLGETKSASAGENRNFGYFFGTTDNGLDDVDGLSLKKVIVLQANDDELLDEGAFKNFVSVETIAIPAVKEIGVEAFAECSALKEIYYGSQVEANNFVQITTVGEGEAATTKTVTPRKIGARAFMNCFSTAKEEFTMTVPFVGAEDKSGDGGEELANNPYSFAYTFGGADYISEKLTTVTVLSNKVSPYAFSGCEYLKVINLPETLTEIGKYAFDGCKELEAAPFLTNAKKLTKIGEGAFRNCGDLTAVVVPDCVQYIEIAAFEGCDGLKTMTLPFVGYSIGYELGANGEKDFYEASQRHFGYIFHKSASTNIQNDYVPEKLTTVIVTKAESVVGQAFNGCTNIEYVTLPVTVEEIGSEAFKGCTSLVKVTFNDVQATDWKITTIDDDTFNQCVKLEEIILPKSVKTIGMRAFSSCQKLETIKTARETRNVLNVDKIEGRAFLGAFTKTTELSLELHNVAEIGARAFKEAGLQKFKITLDESLAPTNFSGTYTFYNSKVVTVELPDCFTRIEDSTFEACSQLTKFQMPKNIQFIGSYAFSGCSKLTIVSTDEDFDEQNVLSFDHAVKIGERAFNGCKSLKEIVFNNVDEYDTNDYGIVMEIGKQAFYGCSGVTRVYLREYKYNAKDGVYVEEGVGLIGASAFYGCGSASAKVNIICGATERDGGWDELCFQGANVANNDQPYVGGISYDEYLKFRNSGYELWSDYQASLNS